MRRVEKSNFRACAWICTLAYTFLLTGCDLGLNAPTEDANGIYLNTLSSVETPGNILLVQGNNAYVIYRYCITGFDISDRFNPRRLPDYFIAYEINDAVMAGSYIYCACHEYYSPPAHELTIVNISSPSSPNIAGSLELEYKPEGIEIDGDYAFLRAGYHLVIADVSSPTDPQLVKTVHLQDSLVDCIVENKTGYLLFNSKVAAYDFSDVAKPLRLCEEDCYWNCSTLQKNGEYLYVIARSLDQRIAAVRIEGPKELRLIRSLKMPNQVLDIDFDEYGVASDNSMVYLLNISDPSFPCVAEGMVGGARSVVTQGDYIYYVSGSYFAIMKVEEIR